MADFRDKAIENLNREAEIVIEEKAENLVRKIIHLTSELKRYKQELKELNAPEQITKSILD